MHGSNLIYVIQCGMGLPMSMIHYNNAIEEYAVVSSCFSQATTTYTETQPCIIQKNKHNEWMDNVEGLIWCIT